MSWTFVFVLAGTAYGFKVLGLVLLGGRRLPAVVERCSALIPAALVAAIVVKDTLSQGQHLQLDARAIGVGVARVRDTYYITEDFAPWGRARDAAVDGAGAGSSAAGRGTPSSTPPTERDGAASGARGRARSAAEGTRGTGAPGETRTHDL